MKHCDTLVSKTLRNNWVKRVQSKWKALRPSQMAFLFSDNELFRHLTRRMCGWRTVWFFFSKLALVKKKTPFQLFASAVHPSRSHSVCACQSMCVHDVMLHLLQRYFTPPPLIRPVRERQHGSLTCHIVAWHCLMIRECWRHSAASGVIDCCGGAAALPQIRLGPRPRLSEPPLFLF